MLLNEIAELNALATQGVWSSNCGSEISARVGGCSVRIGHFNGCAADAAAACALRNSIGGHQQGSPSVPHSVSLEELAGIMAASTAGEWRFDEEGYVYADTGGEEVQIGSFQGCVADARAVCEMHNSAQAIIDRAISKGVPDGARAPGSVTPLSLP